MCGVRTATRPSLIACKIEEEEETLLQVLRTAAKEASPEEQEAPDVDPGSPGRISTVSEKSSFQTRR